MKQLLILSALVCTCYFSRAQITTSLAVNQPPATISEWWASNTAIIYVVDKGGAVASQSVVIKTELKTSDGTLVATKDLAKSPVVVLTAGTRIFYSKDVFPLELMNFNGSYKTTLERTGQLPAGTYQLNVQLVEPGTFAPLTPVQSRMFTLMAPQLPFLVLPVDEDKLDAKTAETAIIFRWTPLQPRPQASVQYRLQVFEILPYQQPLQALRGNQALLDVNLLNQTQYIWRPQLSFSTDTLAHRFIWTVQTLTAQGVPVVTTSGNGESRSEPKIFSVVPLLRKNKE